MESIKNALGEGSIIPMPILSDLGKYSLKKAFSYESHRDRAVTSQLWNRLSQTARDSAVIGKHFTTACNAICVLLQCIRRCDDGEMVAFVYSSKIWYEGFGIVQKAFNDGKIKPALQVLETLLSILHDNPNQAAAASVLTDTINEMVEIIILGQPEARVKEACIVLSCFLRKSKGIVAVSRYFDAISHETNLIFDQRCLHHGIDSRSQGFSGLGKFLLSLLFVVEILESRTAALKLFSYLCSAGDNHDYTCNVQLASQVIDLRLRSDPESARNFTREVFATILAEKAQFHLFLDQYQCAGADQHLNFTILLSIIQTGRAKGFVVEEDLPRILKESLVPDAVEEYAGFQTLLSCSEPEYRLQAVSLLTLSPSTNLLVPVGSLYCLIDNLGNVHDDSDAYYRDEYLSIIKRFVKRLEMSAFAATRDSAKQTNHPSMATTSGWYDEFLNLYLDFLVQDIHPQISYPRHILALCVLNHLIGLASCTGILVEWPKKLLPFCRPLLNLIMDPYEDVRVLTSELLPKVYALCQSNLQKSLEELGFVDNVRDLSARTNRGDHADALGRAYLLSTIVTTKEGESLVNTNPIQTVLEDLLGIITGHVANITDLDPSSPFPLHGTLLGVAHCMSTSTAISQRSISKAIEISSRIWNLVQINLCIDSPERTTELVGLDVMIGPKDALAYSWRALRDSSLILQSILKHVHHDSDDLILEQIGDLCLEQLLKLRHRGAFSTVAHTFLACCQKAHVSDLDSHRSVLLLRWQEAAFLELDLQAAKLTRRSAGLPAIFAGLLNPEDNTKLMRVSNRLSEIAGSEIVHSVGSEGAESSGGVGLRLPQVHALNCLKDIMTSSRLRKVTELLVVDMLGLSAHSLGSELWAIRNCGLMLFRACINRLTPEASTTSIIQASHHYDQDRAATPLTVALDLLYKGGPTSSDQGCSEPQHLPEIVFAALDLLGRIPRHTKGSLVIDNIFEEQLGNNLWAVRQHAADLLAGHISTYDAVVLLTKILKNSGSILSINELHGRLLCSRTISRKIWEHSTSETSTEAAAVLTLLSEFADTNKQSFGNPLIASSYLDILNDSLCNMTPDSHSFKHILEHLPSQSMKLLCDLQADHALLDRAFLLFKTYWCLSSIDVAIDLSERPPIKFDELLRDGSMPWATAHEDSVLHTLKEIARSRIPRQALAYMFVSAVQSDVSDRVATFSMQLLSTNQHELLQFLTRTQLQALVKKTHVGAYDSREMLNTKLVLHSALTAALLKHDPSSEVVVPRRLITALCLSSSENVEMPTRMAAAQALASLAPHLVRKHAGNATNIDHLVLLLLIYNFLNDDDEDIRAITIRAAKSMQLTPSPGMWLPTAAAARKSMRKYIFQRYSKCSEFTVYVFGIMMGAGLQISHTAEFLRETLINSAAVGQLLNTVIRRADDLFAEEKQNLYLDDIANVTSWVEEALGHNLASVDEVYLHSIKDWIMAGLLEIQTIVQGNVSVAATSPVALGPLGPTYNEEILTIAVRVVKAAHLLLDVQLQEGQGMSGADWTQVMRQQLQVLADTCRRSDAHELLQLSIVKALETK